MKKRKNFAKNWLAYKGQNHDFQNPCSVVCLFHPFSPHIWDFCKYGRTLKWSTEASFKYFYTRPKYVIRDIVIYCCLNLRTRSCTKQAQKLPYLNFEFCKIFAFLCLLCAQYYVRQYIYMSCKTYFGLVKKYLKLFVINYFKV